MKIRAFEKSDINSLKKLFCDYYSELDCEDEPAEIFDGLVERDLREGLISAAVAEEGGVLGFVIWQIDDVVNDWCLFEGRGDIRELFVRADMRKRGVGTALVAFAESAIGGTDVYLLPTPESERFFIKCGYSDGGEYCAELDNKVFVKNN